MGADQPATVRYPRLLIKLSGEALGHDGVGLDPAVLRYARQEILSLRQLGTEVALVVGGGNFLRGAQLSAAGFDRVNGDRMGMLATVMNALALAETFRAGGVPALALSAVAVPGIVEGYRREVAQTAMAEGQVVVLAGGTGNPFFSTDSAAALRAAELGAAALIKATKVDGVYDRDPMKDPDAVCFDSLTYQDVIERELGVMDLTAVTLCQANNIPIIVLNMHRAGALERVARGETLGTSIGAC
jgi:uridylate kinase